MERCLKMCQPWCGANTLALSTQAVRHVLLRGFCVAGNRVVDPGAAASERRRCIWHSPIHSDILGKGPAIGWLVQHRCSHPGCLLEISIDQQHAAAKARFECCILKQEPGLIKHWAANPPCIYCGEFEAVASDLPVERR